MRKRLLYSLLPGVAFSLAPFTLSAQHPGSPQPPNPASPTQSRGMNDSSEPMAIPHSQADDKTFLKNAAAGGLAEVELGKLAAGKGSTDGVKQFGQRMVEDHSKANELLKQVAGRESIAVPDSLDAKAQARVDKLAKLSGAQFDRAYIKDQVKDHEQDVREFQLEAENGLDPDVKHFAAQTLPTLKEHLTMIKDLRKNSNSTSRK